jgi:hypothetical protein
MPRRGKHEQSQDLAVPVGAHVRRVLAGQQLAGGAHGIDRVALARAAPAYVRGGVDLSVSEA